MPRVPLLLITSDDARSLAATGFVEPSYDGLNRPSLRVPGMSAGGYFAYKVAPGSWRVDLNGTGGSPETMVPIRKAFEAAGMPLYEQLLTYEQRVAGGWVSN